MSHNIKSCTSCESSPNYGCRKARLELRQAYDEACRAIRELQPAFGTGVIKVRGAHDLEGDSLKEMRLKLEELHLRLVELQDDAVPLPTKPAVASVFELEFSGAPS